MRSLTVQNSSNIKIDGEKLFNITIIDSKDITITCGSTQTDLNADLETSIIYQKRMDRFGLQPKSNNLDLDKELPFKRPARPLAEYRNSRENRNNNKNVAKREYLDEDLKNYKKEREDLERLKRGILLSKQKSQQYNNSYKEFLSQNTFEGKSQKFKTYGNFLDDRIEKHRNRQIPNISDTIYISQLHNRTEYEELNDIFSKYGKLKNLKICSDNSALITFEDARSAKDALMDMNGRELDEIELNINFTRSFSMLPDALRK